MIRIVHRHPVEENQVLVRAAAAHVQSTREIADRNHARQRREGPEQVLLNHARCHLQVLDVQPAHPDVNLALKALLCGRDSDPAHRNRLVREPRVEPRSIVPFQGKALLHWLIPDHRIDHGPLAGRQPAQHIVSVPVTHRASTLVAQIDGGKGKRFAGPAVLYEPADGCGFKPRRRQPDPKQKSQPDHVRHCSRHRERHR